MQVESHYGDLEARVFIEDGERALGVVLTLNTQVVGCLRINEPDHDSAQSQLEDWLVDFGIMVVPEKLAQAVQEEFETLLRIRKEGMSPALGWLGSPGSRRLESSYLCAFV